MVDKEQGWLSARLEELLTHVIGGDWGKGDDYVDDDFETVSCIRGSEFKNWKTELGATAVIRRIKSSSLATRQLADGDLLVEISGGGPDQPVGRTVLITKQVLERLPYPAICTNFLRLARPSNYFNSAFLNHYLTKFYNSGEVVNYQGGSNNLRNLKFKEYSKIEIPIPPLAEQTVITDKLNTLLAQVETTKARLERIHEILKTFRQSVLAAAVSGKLTEEFRKEFNLSISKGVLGDFVSVDIGHAFKSKEFTNSGVKLLRGQNIEPGSLKWDETKYYPKERLEEYSHLFIRANDIILAMDRPIISTGLKLARAKERDLPCVLVQRVARFKDFNGLTPDFLYLLLSDTGFTNYIQPNQTGSDIPHISGKQILSYEVEIPTMERQIKIARRVEELFAYASKIEQNASVALESVKDLTQSILAKAFRGELTADWRAANPDLFSGDNSAEALLAKIKAERDAIKKQPNQKRTAVKKKTGSCNPPNLSSSYS